MERLWMVLVLAAMVAVVGGQPPVRMEYAPTAAEINTKYAAFGKATKALIVIQKKYTASDIKTSAGLSLEFRKTQSELDTAIMNCNVLTTTASAILKDSYSRIDSAVDLNAFAD